MKKIMLTLVLVALVFTGGMAFAENGSTTKAVAEKSAAMKPMRFYLDTHDRAKSTFPAKLSQEDFEGFFAKYEKACAEEGVVLLRLHLSLEEGKAFCLTMAPDVDSVKRAHDKVGLKFDSITEITTAIPGDAFFKPKQ